MTLTQAQRFNPIEGNRDFGLYPGNIIEITKGSGVVLRKPNWIEVVQETPLFIVARYFFKHWDGTTQSYTHCLNKHQIATGDIDFYKQEYYEAEEDDDEGLDLWQVC